MSKATPSLIHHPRPGRAYALAVAVGGAVGYLAAALLVGGGQLP